MCVHARVCSAHFHDRLVQIHAYSAECAAEATLLVVKSHPYKAPMICGPSAAHKWVRTLDSSARQIYEHSCMHAYMHVCVSSVLIIG